MVAVASAPILSSLDEPSRTSKRFSPLAASRQLRVRADGKSDTLVTTPHMASGSTLLLYYVLFFVYVVALSFILDRRTGKAVSSSARRRMLAVFATP